MKKFGNRYRIISTLAMAILLMAFVTPAGAYYSDHDRDGIESYSHLVVFDAQTHKPAHLGLNKNIKPMVSSSPTGLSPASVKSAYNFSTSLTAGAGKTIAIVDAYNDPTAEHDLGVFSTQYGLPACTKANGCFSQVSQTGTSTLPATDGGWGFGNLAGHRMGARYCSRREDPVS